VSVQTPRPTSVPRCSLGELIESLDRPGAPADGAAAALALTGITHDSRQVRPGDLYAALPGSHAHGADFYEHAVRAGAAAVLTDPAGAAVIARTGGRAAPDSRDLPVVVVDNPREQLGAAAARIFGKPSEALRLLGVTGTNGKTTVAFLLDAGLRAAGHVTGLLGTVETRVAGERLPAVRTTPEASDLQALLAVMVERGVTAVSMEVSSHALAMHRVDGMHFSGAAFTNLSEDHLDFHRDMEEYFAAKAALFAGGRVGVPVVGVDTDWGRRLASSIPGATTYGLENKADWQAGDIRAGVSGSSFVARGPYGVEVGVRIALPGRFNVGNALCALALLVSAGVPAEVASSGLAEVAGVPGRMERIDAGQEFLALVDYAHTPDAVTTLLDAVRPLVPGRVIVVLGCGGDRDRAKRPLMAAAAAGGADLVVLTSDNPRSEDPLAILSDMRAGLDAVSPARRARVTAELDRQRAIAVAVDAAGPGDAVVVAGKGHETGQEAAGVVTPFDDREVLRETLTARAGRR
jgi:UDP-N-acetylmuramoyl-L-alanyl-D-glutamate--2,6-diaminopimelate ligase